MFCYNLLYIHTQPHKRFLISPHLSVYFPLQGSPLSLQVYKRYPEGLGKALYREQFDFNAEPPWDPS